MIYKRLANRSINIEYFGKSVHSAYPEGGINTLQATNPDLQHDGSLQGLFPLKTNINGIIRKGKGTKYYSEIIVLAEFSLRS